MLTDKQIELAARHYCELLGLDPDEQVGHGAEPDSNGFVPDVMLYCRRWQLVARKLKERELENAALTYGASA